MPYATTITEEASILSRYSNDLDNFRRYYSLKEETSDETILIKFIAPKIIAFEDYRFCLLQNSETKLLSPSQYYRPDYTSFDEYGTPNLWALLMFINNVPTLEDYSLENILVPTPTVISKIATDVVKRNLLTELVPLSDYPPKPTVPLFSRQIVMPLLRTQSQSIPLFTPADMYFIRETFTVDVVMARERYVDLQFEPVFESVVLKIKNGLNYLYNKHYLIIRGTSKNNRLTWDPRKILNGIGLLPVLIEGIEFEVSYARKVVI
jgi:hypothetical protein